MRYLWRKPVGLDNTKLVRFLGEEPHTPLDRRHDRDLADMGCLGEQALPLSPSWGEHRTAQHPGWGPAAA